MKNAYFYIILIIMCAWYVWILGLFASVGILL